MAGWIKGAIKRPGQLHRDLGVPQGQKIPGDALREAASAGGKLGQRARLAQTLAKFADGGEVEGHSSRAAGRFRRACHGR